MLPSDLTSIAVNNGEEEEEGQDRERVDQVEPFVFNESNQSEMCPSQTRVHNESLNTPLVAGARCVRSVQEQEEAMTLMDIPTVVLRSSILRGRFGKVKCVDEEESERRGVQMPSDFHDVSGAMCASADEKEREKEWAEAAAWRSVVQHRLAALM